MFVLIKNYHLFLLFILFPFIASGQPKFSIDSLNQPAIYGPLIRGDFKTIEVVKYRPEIHRKNCINLNNGFRKSPIINENDWLEIKEDVVPREITLVFSKYPLRKGVYHEIYPLLCDRLKVLFMLDPDLNDIKIKYNILLQTDCKNDKQVSELFHGIIIKYDTVISEQADLVIDSFRTGPGFTTDQLLKLLDFPSALADSISKITAIVPKYMAIQKYIEQLLKAKAKLPASLPTPESLKMINRKINLFIKAYSFNSLDSVVYKVLDRNTSWDSILVIVDWTGSMYRYGADVLKWHVLNFNRSPIKYFVLFNDGDLNTIKDIGKTGGIYNQTANKLEELFYLYNLIIMKGDGGDSEENDIEAILKGIDLYPDHKNIILIANNSCIRDMELMDEIQEPVKVIICGYDASFGVNPQYIELAQKTGGSIHTIQDDIFFTETGNGSLLAKKKLKTSLDYCSNSFRSSDYIRNYTTKKFNDIDSAFKFKYGYKSLNLANQNLTKIPSRVNKITYLSGLYLSGNHIQKINLKKKLLESLQMLDLSNNQLVKIPQKLIYCINIRELNLSNNQIAIIPGYIFKYRSIRAIDLSHNSIDSLPTISCRSIRILKLNNNHIQYLPSLQTLRNTLGLDLSNNELTELPPSIGNLRKLKNLNLKNNKLTTLPPEISRLRSLKILDLRNNLFDAKEIEKIQLLLPRTQIEY